MAEEEVTLNSSGNGNNAAENSRGDVANALLQNPGVLASLQDRLPFDGKLQAVAHYQSLPKPIKRRVKALKKLQFDTIKLEAEFYKEMHVLEMKYAARQQQYFDRRREILTGNVEPNDDDCDWPSEDEVDEETATLAATLRDKVQLTVEQEVGPPPVAPAVSNGEAAASPANPEVVPPPATGDTATAAPQEDAVEEKPASPQVAAEPVAATVQQEAITGVTDFWLTVLKNVDLTSDMIQEHDEPILKSLNDVRTKMYGGDEPGFVVEFHFAPNEYFTNSVLTKQYYLRMDPEEEAPFQFEGPEIVRCKGCEIHWKKGKNVTVKVVKKVQKHKGRGDKRTVTKTVQNDSFFNFFNAQEQSLDDLNDDDEEAEQLLNADFEIAHFIRERVVPRAVLYFTGDALEDDEDYEEEEEEEEGDDDDFDNSDVIDPPGGRGAVRGGSEPTKQDCKQQ